MNKQRILRVAQVIEQLEVKKPKPKWWTKLFAKQIKDIGFNMNHWRDANAHDWQGRTCGTSACIGGWTEILFPNETVSACDILGLKDHQADELFYGYKDGGSTSPKQAVKVLRHLAKTGRVDWDV